MVMGYNIVNTRDINNIINKKHLIKWIWQFYTCFASETASAV